VVNAVERLLWQLVNERGNFGDSENGPFLPLILHKDKSKDVVENFYRDVAKANARAIRGREASSNKTANGYVEDEAEEQAEHISLNTST
ncbi:unnamed protein product, partial [Amoebophrya sp. A25]